MCRSAGHKGVWEINILLKNISLDFPSVTVDKNPPANAGDRGRFHMV